MADDSTSETDDRSTDKNESMERAKAALAKQLGDDEGASPQPAQTPQQPAQPAQPTQEQPQGGDNGQAAQPTTEQQPAEEPKPTSEAQERESRRWAELERRDAQARKEHQERMQELQNKEQELKKQQEEWQEQLEALKQLETDPHGALRKLGYPWEEMAKRAVAGQQQVDTTKIEQKMKEQREELEQRIEEERKQREQIEHDRKVQQVRGEIQETIGKDPDDQPKRWALLRQEPEWDAEVIDLISAEYQNSGQVLTYHDAADKLESYLRDQYKRRLSDEQVREILLGQSDAGSGQQTQPAAQQPSQAPAQHATGAQDSAGSAPSAGAGSQTLSNAAASEVSGREGEPQTAEDYKRRAMAVLEESGGL